MPAASDFHVEGLQRAVRQLQSLGVEVEDLKAAFGRISDEMMPIYRRHTPVRSGRLRGNYRKSKSKNRAVLYTGSARVPYARVINYGWPARSIRPAGFVEKGDQEIGPKAIFAVEAEINRLIRTKDLR